MRWLRPLDAVDCTVQFCLVLAELSEAGFEPLLFLLHLNRGLEPLQGGVETCRAAVLHQLLRAFDCLLGLLRLGVFVAGTAQDVLDDLLDLLQPAPLCLDTLLAALAWAPRSRRVADAGMS